MDELLDDLLASMQEGVFNNKEELQSVIDSDGIEALYELTDKTAFPDMEEYVEYFSPLKKKDETVLPTTSPTENTESNTPTPTVVTPGSSDSSGVIEQPTDEVEDPNIVVDNEPVVDDQTIVGIDDPLVENDEVFSDNRKTLFDLDENGEVIDLVKEEEDETWLEESWLGKGLDWAFDDMPILGVLSADFWGDMYRAIGNGFTKGQSVDESIELFAKGKNISDEDLANYIAAVNKSNSVVQSDEMKNFSKIYEENGGGVLGFILGFGSNLSIAPELLIDSMASMLNPASAAAAGAGALTGAAAGTALTAYSGPGALFGAGAGAVAGTFGGASAALEFGMSYTEFMKEEVEAKGGEFNQSGIKSVLNDEEALMRIRNKASARGLAIGMIDAMTAGIAGKVVGGTSKALAKGVAKKLAAGGPGVVTRPMVNKGIEIAAGLGIEIVGGSTGEAVARLAAGQEMDVAEIGLEGFAGAGNAPITVGLGVYRTPRYKIGKDNVTSNYMLAVVGTATPAEIAAMDIKITNDPKVKALIDRISQEAQFDADISKSNPNITGKDKKALIDLEIEKSELPDSDSETTRIRRNEINKKISAIVDGNSSITESVSITRDGNTFTETISVTKNEAIAQLEADGVTDPSDAAIKSMQEALMQDAKDSDLQAEKALVAERKADQADQANAEASVSDQDVLDALDKDLYTKEEFENVKKSLIKKAKDAIQESSTTEMDVQESSQDGEGVGDINNEQEVTEEGTTNNEQEGVESSEVKEEKIKDDDSSVNFSETAGTVKKDDEEFTTKRVKQPQDIEVPGSRSVNIVIDENGKPVAVNRKNKRPIKKPPLGTQKFILENVLDVNEGKKSVLPEGLPENTTPDEIDVIVAETSNNVREIAEAIDNSTKQNRSMQESRDTGSGLDALINVKEKSASPAIKFTPESWESVTGESPKESGVEKSWIATEEEGGVSLEDGFAELVNQSDQLPGDVTITSDQVVDFIKQNPNQEAINKFKLSSETNGVIDLKAKFELLTGLKPTKKNLNTVLAIDPNRSPNVLVAEQNKSNLEKQSTEPGVFTKGKRGVNPKRITQGKTKKSTLVVDADGLVTQIKLESKAAKKSESAYIAAQKRVLDQISDLKVRGVVRAKQALIMTNKVLRTNFSKEGQVTKLTKYVTDVMNSATINDQIKRIQKKTKRKGGGVLYNIKKGKIGSANNALIDVLKTLAKTDISSVPLDKLNSLEALMDTYGANKKILDIKNIGADTKAGLDIINSLDNSALVEVKPTKRETKKSKEYDVDLAIKEIKSIKIDIDKVSKKDNKKVAKAIMSLTTEDIKGLIKEKKDGTFDYSLLEDLRGVMQNLSQGVVNSETFNIITETNSNRASKPVSKVFGKITLSGIKKNFKNISSTIKLAITSKSPSGKNILLDKVRSNVAAYVDDAFGNLNSTVIFDNTFGKLAQVYESFKVDTDQGFSKIESAEKILEYDGKGLIRRTARVGNSANKIVAKKYKIRLLQLAREYVLNLDKNGKANPVSPSAQSLIDATIEFYKKPENKNVYANDLKILEKLVKEFSVDGEINLDKLEKSLTKGEKKALSIYDEVNNSLAEKAAFTSSVVRSNRVDLLNGYSHRVVLSNETTTTIDDKATEFSKASTKSGTFENRVPGPKPVSFDPSLSAQRGLQETNLDYYMTGVIREVMQTINKVSENMKADGTDAQIQAADALKKSVEEVIKITYGETMRAVGITEVVLNKIKKTAYQAILASAPRMGVELASNMSYIMANPKAAALGFTKFVSLSYLGGKLGADILNNLGSSETTKQYSAKTFTSRFADMSNFAQSSPDSMRAKSAFMNVVGILLRLGPKQTASAVDSIAGAIISTPDRAMTRPMWYGTFALKFEAETGIKLSKKDFIEIGEGTSVYLTDEYSDAVKKSTREADKMGVKISSSQNPFKGVIKNMRRNDPSQPALLNTYRAVNKFMATFSLFEYGTVRNAIGALQRSGDMSRLQAAGVLAAATTRMTMYPLLYGIVAAGFDELFTDVETEEDESSIEDMIMRQTVGTVLTLLTRRSMGNLPNLLPSFMIEQFNKEMLGDFREGDYDPFKHSIVFSQFNEGDLKKKGLIETAIGILSGPMGPLLKTLQRSTDLGVRAITNKTEESRQKNMDELTSRMVLEALGNLGLIPFYKDVRRVVMKEMFEDGVIDRRKSKTKKQRKQYMEFLKISDPTEYKKQLRLDKLKKSNSTSSSTIDNSGSSIIP